MKLGNSLIHLFQSLTRSQGSLWRFAFILIISYFVAKAANLMIAHKYLPLEFSGGSFSSGSSFESAQKGPEVNIQTILSRNIFDSEIRNRVSQGAKTPTADGPISPSTLPLELGGTIVFKNSKFSVSLIRERSSKKAGYYGIGDTVLNARVHKIERFRVIIENGGRLESLELRDAESKMGPGFFNQESSDTGISTLPPSSGLDNSGGGFEEIGPNRFVVPQSEIDKILTNFAQVLTQARMVPNITPDNKTAGFKVFQIKSGSIYDKMRMLNNDIIKRVNGQDLDSFEKATGLFTALRNEKTITIDLVRNGQKVNYTYEIR